MFKVILIMFCGVLLGLFCNKRKINFKSIDSLIYIMILFLLFSLGISLGVNKELLNKWSIISSKAFIITVSGLGGCLIFGVLLYKFMFKNKI